MAIPISCACGKQLSVKDEFAGRKVKCPACQKLLLVPASEEFAEDEFPDEPAESPQKSRGGEKSTSRGKGSKKGKKASGTNRGLLIGLVAGGGMLVVGLLAWLLWPSKPDVVANAPAGNAAATPATGGTSGTTSNSTPPLPPTNSPANSAVEVTGDLKTLQGDWHVVEIQSGLPIPPRDIDEAKERAITLAGDVMTVWQSRGSVAYTIKLDPTQNPKTIDLIPNFGRQARPTVLGIYSLEGETLKVVWGVESRPTSFTLEPGSMQGSIVLNRGRPVGLENAKIPVDNFDYKAWWAAEPKLMAIPVIAFMSNVEGDIGVPEGQTHCDFIDLPETADGTLSPELWTILSSLSHVVVRTAVKTDATLQQLSQHSGLVGLRINERSMVTATGIAALKNCPTLRSLSFDRVPVSPEMLRAVAKACPNLRSLHFSGVPVSPEMLRTITNDCPKLRSLRFSGVPVSSDVLGAVSQLSEQQAFGINDIPVSSEMLGVITQMSQLESLSLENTGVTDADVVQIVKLTKLKALFLNNTIVTDAGLNTLKRLKDLTMLGVDGLTVTSQAVADFQAALPKCIVFAPTLTETAPTIPQPATGTELVGDLQTLQGTWQVSDVAVPPELPKDRAAALIAQMKQMSWTIKDNVLTMSNPLGSMLFTIKLDPTQAPKTIDLIPVDGKFPLSVGLYSIEGETWTLCMTENSKVRPPAMKADQAMLVTFQRGSATDAAPASLFDLKAWQAAEGKLKAMKVPAVLEPVFGQSGFPKGCTHVVLLDPPATADGTMSPELWAIVTSLNYVQARLVSSSDATLQQLAQHPGLLGIHIGGKSTITAKGITSLKGCPNLRGLYFGEVPVSPELLSAVSQLSELRNIGIGDAPVTGEMLGSITQLSQLESLSLQNTGITDADMVQIVKLTNLKTLFLDNTKVTDSGLQTLKSLKNLTMFSVRGLNVTPQAVADFEAALPKCQVLK